MSISCAMSAMTNNVIIFDYPTVTIVAITISIPSNEIECEKNEGTSELQTKLTKQSNHNKKRSRLKNATWLLAGRGDNLQKNANIFWDKNAISNIPTQSA